MATKNDIKNRKKNEEKKTYNGKEIEPILYVGTKVGNGKYIAAKYSKTNDMVIGANGKPLAWDEI